MARQTALKDVKIETLQRAAEVIKMLGHAERLKIVEALEAGEASVSEIQDRTGLAQATVSQHLSRMRGCNIVKARREGANVYYQITEQKVYRILACIRECDT